MHFHESTFFFDNPEMNIEHEMVLIFDADSLPLYYYSDIQTPVCIDNICKPLYIELYWDLLGNYLGYGEYKNHLLSKYDHETFDTADYLKLHKLLSNPHSKIEQRKISDLYDLNQKRKEVIQFKGKDVDGITGATKLEIKETVVDGALFSCYTLYHLVYGTASVKIKDNLNEIYNEEVAREFLNSENSIYQAYAIKNLRSEEFQENLPSIISIFSHSSPLNRSYILKKMPKELYQHSLLTYSLYQEIEKWDLNTRTLLIQNLEFADPQVLIGISEKIAYLTKNQILMYLDHLNRSQHSNMDIIKKNLHSFSENPNFPYGYAVKEYLKKN